MPFEFERLSIPEVILIKPKVFQDQRGFFMETFKDSDFKNFGVNENFSQDNHSKSFDKGTIRGLHYQMHPNAQGKLVRVVAGRIFDVAIDLRRNSPTYAKWVAVELTAENNHMLWIPAGFAHGNQSLEDNTQLLYKCTAEYATQAERCILWDDPDIGIDWPIKDNPLLSIKDAAGVSLRQAEVYS